MKKLEKDKSFQITLIICRIIGDLLKDLDPDHLFSVDIISHFPKVVISRAGYSINLNIRYNLEQNYIEIFDDCLDLDINTFNFDIIENGKSIINSEKTKQKFEKAIINILMYYIDLAPN